MNFTSLQNGMCEGFVIIKKCEKKTARNGSEYLDLIFSDNSGEISAKLWDSANAEFFESEMVVKVRGQIEQYNGKDQFRISQIRPASQSDGYKLSELVPASETGGEQLYSMIMKKVSGFSDNDFKAVVTDIYEQNKEKLIKYPAALRLHHAMVGGLLYHTMSIVTMAEEVCRIYKNVNRELLLSGAILHDVAKVWELEESKTGLAKGYTAPGELVGHLVKGAMLVSESAKKLGVPESKAALLEHMLLSHHGVPEFGSPVRPMFIEAEILSSLDSLDAAIFEMSSAVEKVEAGSFSDRQWALDNRKIYNHGLAPDSKYKVTFKE